MSIGLSANARLLRGFAVDFLTSHDVSVVPDIMDPAYRLSISGHLFCGRDESYLPVTVAQLDQFPGLCVTVHDVVLGDDAVAMRFTEHGVSARYGLQSSWGGITLFRIANGKLHHGWAEEDYFARKLQLKSGMVDAIAAPHPAPWDEPVRGPDFATELAILDWFGRPSRLFDGIEEISSGGPLLGSLIEPAAVDVSMMFTAGPRGAFHAVVSGRSLGGGGDVGGTAGGVIGVALAGIVDVADGNVVRVQLCGDRLGLHRRLMAIR